MLSSREQESLTLLRDGLTVPVIEKKLYISQSTVESLVSKPHERLGESNPSIARSWPRPGLG